MRVLQIFIIAILALAASPAQAGAALIPLRVAYDGFSMTTAPMNYAQQTGIFAKHGLDVRLIYLEGGTTVTQALVGGSVDIVQNSYTSVAAASVAGAGTVFIGGISNKLPFQLVVKPEIRTAADLRGKRIAISRIGSSTDVAANYSLRHLGLARTDVTILQLGGEGTRTAAMASGQIDGSFEQYPRTAELEAQGFRVLVDCLVVAGDYPNTSYASTRRFLAANPDTAKRFMAAISEAIHEFKRTRAEGIRLTAAFLNSQPGPALEKAYDVFTRDVYPDPPRPSLAGIAIVLAELKATNPAAARVRPADLVDTTALDALEREGFFARLNQ